MARVFIETRTRVAHGKRVPSSYRLKWRHGATQQGTTVREPHEADAVAAWIEARDCAVYAADVDVDLILGRVEVREGIDRTTVADYLDDYLASVAHMRPGSVKVYESHVRMLRRAYGSRQVRSLTKGDFATLVRDLLAPGGRTKTEGYALATVDAAIGTWRAALRPSWDGGERSCRKGDPTKGVRVDYNDRRGVAVFLSDAEVHALLDGARAVRMGNGGFGVVTEAEQVERGAGLALAIELLVSTGIRRGEFLGLTGRHLIHDGRNYMLDVTQQQAGSARVGAMSATKSDSSTRKVPVSDDLARRILAVLVSPDDSLAGRMLLGRARPCSAEVLNTRFDRAVEAARLADPTFPTKRVRVHDLRHTCASRWLREGVNLVIVSRKLGHSSTAITSDLYGHLDPSADDMIAAVPGFGAAPAPKAPSKRATARGAARKPARHLAAV